MYACMYVCYVCMSVRIYLCSYVCMYVCMYCMYVLYVFMKREIKAYAYVSSCRFPLSYVMSRIHCVFV